MNDDYDEPEEIQDDEDFDVDYGGLDDYMDLRDEDTFDDTPPAFRDDLWD